MNYLNKTAKLIFYSGVIYVTIIFSVGFILGIKFQDPLLGVFYTSGFNWIMMMAIWISGFMTSLMFFGGAEIIELLHQQNYKIINEESKVKRTDYLHSKYEDL